jgi:methyl-accepting chemotaxis protein
MRSLMRQLGGEPAYAANIAGKIASGDLAVEITMRENDASSLLCAVKSMRDSLTNIVGQVRNGTEAIATESSFQSRTAVAFPGGSSARKPFPQ